MEPDTKRTGRRPGSPDTRGEILEAAREVFASHGFERSSIRRIAGEAGVDPALVHHYFGTKDDLFLESVEAPFEPSELIEQVFAAEGDVGDRLIRAFVELWDSPVGSRAIAFLTTSLTHPRRAQLVEQFLTTQVIKRGLTRLSPPLDHPEVRGSLIASQLLGLGLTRYILRLPALTRMSTNELASVYGPTIQRYLTVSIADLGIRD